MAYSKQMALFKAAQDAILSSAPPYFNLNHPPPMGWWRAKFDLGLPAAAFVHHYQSILGRRTFGMSGGTYHQADLTANWQAAAGITPKQWNGAKGDLGVSGTKLLAFKIGSVGGTKGTRIRPSDQLLAVFGMTLSTYDVVAGLDHRITARRWVKAGPAVLAAARPVSHDEFNALALWVSRGGLARLGNGEYLVELLETHNANKSAA
jgi:hypothetical protein